MKALTRVAPHPQGRCRSPAAPVCPPQKKAAAGPDETIGGGSSCARAVRHSPIDSIADDGFTGITDRFSKIGGDTQREIFHYIETLPVLGTGQLDLRRVRSLA